MNKNKIKQPSAPTAMMLLLDSPVVKTIVIASIRWHEWMVRLNTTTDTILPVDHPLIYADLIVTLVTLNKSRIEFFCQEKY